MSSFAIDLIKRVIVCSPGTEYFRVSELSRHNITRKANPDTAQLQHMEFSSLLSRSGCEVIDIPEMKDHPNSVFTRDAAVVTHKGYVRLRMGLESRRGEETWMAGHLESLGLTCAGTISGAGTVEGGDVILSGHVAFIGCSGRTDKQGLEQISAILKVLDFDVRTVEVPEPFLHLGGAMSILPAGYVLCCQGMFPESFFDGFNIIEVPGKDFVTGNVITLPNNEIIVEKANEVAAGILRGKGFRVHSTDLSEFIKGTGGPSCLVMPA